MSDTANFGQLTARAADEQPRHMRTLATKSPPQNDPRCINNLFVTPAKAGSMASDRTWSPRPKNNSYSCRGVRGNRCICQSVVSRLRAFNRATRGLVECCRPPPSITESF
jgi:hypothetical protein